MKFLQKTFYLFLLGSIFTEVSAQNILYNVSLIPAELKKNANAVVRTSETNIEVKENTNATVKRKFAITILTPKAYQYAVLHEGYDRFSKITNIKVKVYDANGNEIKQPKDDEVIDILQTEGAESYSDNRMKYYDPVISTYPFTVEYSFTCKQTNILAFDEFYPLPDNNISCQSAIFEFTYPSSMNIKFLEKNINIKAEETTGTSIKKKWKFENIPAIDEQILSGNFFDYSPIIYSIPKEFELDGYKGSTETWDAYGAWISSLNKDRDVISEETKTKIKTLTANAKSDEEKIKIVYEFLQNNCRYVSIHYGIGGLQPMKAEDVDKNKYGDCKALTNYMKSLLKSININSNYTIINATASARAMITSPVNPYFNHVLLLVPQKNDTLWLECTSQIEPFAYVGTFTDDRNALMTSDDGKTKIVHSKCYSAEEYKTTRTANLTFQETGDGIAKIKTIYYGLAFDDVFDKTIIGIEDAKKELQKEIAIPNFNILNLNYAVKKERMPQITENINLELRRYASINGNRMFVSLNLMNKIRTIPRKSDIRTVPIVIRRSYTDIDSIKIQIPAGYKVENIQNGTEINSDFGSYKTEITANEKEVLYIRTRTMKKGTHLIEKYQDLVTFYEKMFAADNSKMVLIKQ